jgi:hypothetical protein
MTRVAAAHMTIDQAAIAEAVVADTVTEAEILV